MKKAAFLLPSPNNWLVWLNSLVMIAGLLFFNWRPVMIVMGYFFETIIIGLIHVCKLFVVAYWGKKQKEAADSGAPIALNNGWGILFFIFHYFFFVAVQSIFIFTFLGKAIHAGMADSNAFNVLKQYWLLLQQPDILLIFACLVSVHIADSLKTFFIPQRYHEYTVVNLMMQPYLRIFVQQFVGILSGFLFLFMTNGMPIALLLIVVRLVLDTFFSNKQVL
jgi:hypothetical protein